MLFKYTEGFDLSDFAADLAIEDSYELKAEEKRPFLCFSCSAASKAITLGLKPGEHMIVSNIGGTNAVTVKAISGDTGTSVAAGKVAIVIGSATANASKIYVLN